jgi:diphthine-ammonia ligase
MGLSVPRFSGGDAPVPEPGEPFVCSWSGGKDSCLALHRAVAHGAIPVGLLTMLVEEGRRTRNHGLAIEVVRAQAESLRVPLVTVASSWSEYEQRFVQALRELAGGGAVAAVFGDIDIPSHRQWEEKVCSAAGIKACLPLWQMRRQEMLDEFLALGFEARIVAVNAAVLDSRFLGRSLDRHLVAELSSLGIDACGENGEYHSVVTCGPLFRQPLHLIPRDTVRRSGYWFLDYELGTHPNNGPDPQSLSHF